MRFFFKFFLFSSTLLLLISLVFRELSARDFCRSKLAKLVSSGKVQTASFRNSRAGRLTTLGTLVGLLAYGQIKPVPTFSNEASAPNPLIQNNPSGIYLEIDDLNAFFSGEEIEVTVYSNEAPPYSFGIIANDGPPYSDWTFVGN